MEYVKTEATQAKPSFQLGAFLRKYNLLLLVLVFIVIGSLLSPKFLSVQNFLNLLQQSAVTGIVAIGITFVIIVAGIDLSVGSVLAFAGMVMALLLPHTGPFVAFLAAIASGAVLGWINGFVSTRLTIPPFITTLAMMVAARGLALLLTDGKPVFNLPESVRFFGKNLFGIPVSGLIWIALTLIAIFVLRYTTFGRKLYAIGGNPQSAHLTGIEVNRYITFTYVISGALSALAGIVLASWLTVGQPTAGSGIELDAIAAVVLGGTSLMGGVGGVGGTFVGVLLMSMITNIFNLLGLSSYFQSIFMGIIIVLALVLNKFVIQKKQ